MKLPKFLGVATFWVGWPGICLILRNSHRTRVIIRVGDKVLFVRSWLGEDKLSLPGGGIKSGEDPLTAVIREVREETGLELNQSDLRVVVKDVTLKENGIKYVVDCFMVTLPEVVKTSSKHLEIIESVWQPYQQFLDSNKISNNTRQLIQTWLTMPHLVD